jgi:ribosomal protein S18 acetylase RimI-like enzyme
MSQDPKAPAALSEQVHDWYAQITRGRATTLIELDSHSWGLLTPEWPRSYANNGILVRRDPGAAQLIAWAEEVLGGDEFNHRYVMAMCDLSAETVDGLTRAGYEMEPELQMVRPLNDDDIVPASPLVVVVDEETIRPFNARMWREEWLPTADDETVRQLVGRRATYSRSTDFVSFVVRDPQAAADSNEFVACCDIAIKDWATELDGVTTLADHRQRGYGEILIQTALSMARSSGCDHAVLTALADDWPRHWYSRRGFLETGPAWVATKILVDNDALSNTGNASTTNDHE